MDYDWRSSPLYKLLSSGKHFQLPKGQVVDMFDDRALLNLINKGFIKRYLITNDGLKGIQVIYGPGDIFPLTPVYKSIFNMDIYSGPEQYYYEAMTDIEIFSIDQTSLRDAAEKDPLINKDLFYAAGLRLNSYIHRLESLALRSANKKVAHQLIYLANVFGQKTDQGVVIPVPLTHQNLAEILNLARETVSNCMSRLQDKGLIISDKNIIVTDIERLQLEAN